MARPPLETATLGGGCFWCLEAVYEQVRGVEKVVNGYAGGTVEDPRYEDVSTGETGHAEVVHISFDPSVVTYRELLEIFFTIHDPTTRNRQGGDVGPQYRSVVLFHDPGQEGTAREVVREYEAEGLWPGRFVTEIAPFVAFYPAEEYHQQYFRRNPDEPYCRAVVAPKLAKFRAKWAKKLRTTAPAPGAAPARS